MRRVWPWLLAVAACIAGLVLILTLAPGWAQRLVAALSVAGAAVAAFWAGRHMEAPAPREVSSTEPHDLAEAEAERQVVALDELARADTAEAHAASDGYRDALLGKDADALAAEAAASPAYAGVRPCPRPMPGHGAAPPDDTRS